MSNYERQRGSGTNVGSDPKVGARNRRSILKATAGGAAGVSLAGCLGTYETIAGSESSDEETVTIGMLAPAPESDFIGRSMVQAAELAVAELNDNGGIGGKDVELAVGDTKGSPLEARRQYQRLVLEEEADVTVGMFASEALVSIMDDIAEQETLHLTSGAASQYASQLVYDDYDRYKYHFRVGPTNETDLGLAQIDFMDEFGPEIGWDSIAVLAEDYSWADQPWEIYQNDLDDTAVDVVYEERYPPATENFTEIYQNVEDSGADAAFISTAHTGTDALLNWVGQQRPFAFGGIHVPMQLPNYYEDTEGACEYAIGYTTATAQSEITDSTQDFVQGYADMFDSDPQDMGYNTYDAINLFAHVVEATGTLDTDELIAELEEVEYTGVAGSIEFYDQDHVHAHDLIYDPDTETAVYFQWQQNDDGEGVQEVIWPESQATADYIAPPWVGGA